MDVTVDRVAAAARRARMQVRTHPSLAAHDRDAAAYWRALPVDVRVRQVWTLREGGGASAASFRMNQGEASRRCAARPEAG